MPKIQISRVFLSALLPPEMFPRPREPVLLATRGGYQLFAHRTQYGPNKKYFLSVDGLRVEYWPQLFNIMPRPTRGRSPQLDPAAPLIWEPGTFPAKEQQQ